MAESLRDFLNADSEVTFEVFSQHFYFRGDLINAVGSSTARSFTGYLRIICKNELWYRKNNT